MFELICRLLAFLSPKLAPLWLAHVIATTIALDCRTDHTALGGSCELDAAAMVATAWEEGRFCTECLRGDHGLSVTTWQLRTPDPDLRERLDRAPLAAARRAYFIMRAGAQLCPDAPLAPYAGGCHNRAARAIGERRQAAAQCLLASDDGPGDACDVR